MRPSVHRPEPTARRRARRSTLLLLASACVVLALLVVAIAVLGPLSRPSARPPGVGTTILVPEDSKAAREAESARSGSSAEQAARVLAERPTAVWLTPDEAPIDTVREVVGDLLAQAGEQDAALAIVVYGIPGRDCGSHSAGGLADADEYGAWTAQIGEALRTQPDVAKIVILEPDSLALAPECGNLGERVGELRDAIENISGGDTWIYLDGGHSEWLPADRMAGLISAVADATAVRGFATNVSNYNPTDREFAYAHELAGRLDGMHAIVDTSRNGAGTASTWCNPPDQLVGDPSGTYGDDVVDTNLWVKPPGESDGTCNGGPAAGEWWPAAAVTLTRNIR
jgi:endoglucanase